MFKNNRNRESDVLWIVLVSMLTAFWIVICPAVLRTYVIYGPSYILNHSAPVRFLEACAELDADLYYMISDCFYDTRQLVHSVCMTVRDVFCDEPAPVVYECIREEPDTDLYS